MLLYVAFQHRLGYCLAEISRHCHTMTRIAKRVIHAVHFAHMRHHVEGKVERAAPNTVDLCILQLWKYPGHLTPQDFCASLDCIGRLREECCASAEDHAIVPQAEIIQIMFTIENHPGLGDEFSHKLVRQFLCRNNK